MSDFKWRHYQGAIVLSCVRWYCKYGISYRELEEMMLKRGLEVDHTTIGSVAFLHNTSKAPDAYRRITELDPDNMSG